VKGEFEGRDDEACQYQKREERKKEREENVLLLILIPSFLRP
jgi:hypothetical protein